MAMRVFVPILSMPLVRAPPQPARETAVVIAIPNDIRKMSRRCRHCMAHKRSIWRSVVIPARSADQAMAAHCLSVPKSCVRAMVSPPKGEVDQRLAQTLAKVGVVVYDEEGSHGISISKQVPGAAHTNRTLPP